jgi:hypothetical protein
MAIKLRGIKVERNPLARVTYRVFKESFLPSAILIVFLTVYLYHLDQFPYLLAGFTLLAADAIHDATMHIIAIMKRLEKVDASRRAVVPLLDERADDDSNFR